MNPEETARIDQITEAVHYLLKGHPPSPIPCEDDPEDEIRQLSGKVNQLIRQFKEIQEFIDPLSEGRLDIVLPKANLLASPFKQLHAALGHLTWQTRQIARGDFDQRVDFMGDFSQSFNAMVDALRESREQLLADAERYKTIAELKNHYLNVMAHDIRTPIGAILGFADILLDGQIEGQDRKYVEIIRRNCDNLLDLINNILDMARLEKQRIEIASVPMDIRTMGTDIGELIAPRLADGVQFRFEPDEAMPAYVLGDFQRLQQVLLNLVGNAAKFTRKGAITLTVRIDRETEAGPRLLFSVADTGIGIASDQLDRIFDPFIQAEGAGYSRFGGTGLGLSIARELTALMGGELAVESRLGKGTTFRFHLPFVPVEKPPVQRTPSEEACRISDCRILVVDDDPDSLHLISRQLDQQGVPYALCQKSVEALDRLSEAHDKGDPFTLAWLDIDMPWLNGFELAVRIREDRRFARLRLVACTSHIDKMDAPEKAAVFSFVATKPVSGAAMKRILSEVGRDFDTDAKPCDLAGRRVLVVDDNPINRYLLKVMLEKLSVAVAEAEDGEEGLRKVKTDNFDVVVMDKLMPVMDGVEAIQQIRQLRDRDRVPILAFTADEGGDNSQAMLEAGACAVLPKTLDAETLVERLCRALLS